MSKHTYIKSKTLGEVGVDIEIKVNFSCPVCNNALELSSESVDTHEEIHCDQCDHGLKNIDMEDVVSTTTSYATVSCDIYKIEASCIKCDPKLGGAKIPECLDCRVTKEGNNG